VLTRCLGLPSGANLVVFADETTLSTALLLIEQADALEMQPLLVYFSTATQQRLGKQPLQVGLQLAVREADAVLVCLSGAPSSYEFRNAVREFAYNAGCKVGHMPGIDQATLLLADVNYEELIQHCELLATALLQSNSLTIKTTDAAGRQHCLTVPLDPGTLLPITSDGIIQRASWGNIPSGETFIAPAPFSGDGSIVINGSIRRYVMAADEELVFYFEQGQLVRWEPEDSPAARHFVTEAVESARAQNDANWSQLGEVGLGANPRVDQLTGSMLLDEKKYGTAHIALGDNTDMGGQVKSSIHYDMVTLRPEVAVDGRVIIRDGRLVLTPDGLLAGLSQVQPPVDWSVDLPLSYTAVRCGADEQGRLRRRWDTDSGRVCSVMVGTDEIARHAAEIYEALRQQRRPSTLATIRDRVTTIHDDAAMLATAYLLSRYGLVKPEIT
jgi:hypothetical protein